jgi:hypothetical protein
MNISRISRKYEKVYLLILDYISKYGGCGTHISEVTSSHSLCTRARAHTHKHTRERIIDYW